jgi:hypothetical protein
MTATHRDHSIQCGDAESRGVERRSARALTVLALAVSSLLSAGASAQQAKPKKLYCWDEGGKRVCSDALPASAVGRQRTEFDPKTGTAVNRIGRELTAEERVRADRRSTPRLSASPHWME